MVDTNFRESVKPFFQRAVDPAHQPPTEWTLDPFLVARSLLRMLNNPDAIYQSGFGFCGQVAFLRAWIYRDPKAVVKLALDLFGTGKATIADYRVQACDALLDCPYLKNTPQDPITETVWMICSALADSEDDIAPDFDGYPSDDWSVLWSESSMESEVKRWLEKTGIYQSVQSNIWNCFNFIPGKPDVSTALTLKPDHLTDVLLCINSNMFLNIDSSVPDGLKTKVRPETGVKAAVSNHWIVLNQPIQVVANKVHMNIWTWGGNYDVVLSVDAFNVDFYGYITAAARTNYPKRTLQLNPPDADFDLPYTKIAYTASNSLRFEWFSQGKNVEWFEVQRVYAVGTEWYWNLLSRVAAEDHNNDYHVTLPVQDPTDPYNTTYRVVACHSSCRPDPRDPFNDLYDLVPANKSYSYLYGQNTPPVQEATSRQLHIRYYAYPSPDQIPDGYSPLTGIPPRLGDVAVTDSSGKLIGRAYASGRTEIYFGGTTLISSEPGTPLFIQKIEIGLEYIHQAMIAEPLALHDPAWTKVIEVSVKRVGHSYFDAAGIPHITIPPNLSDADLLGVCFDSLIQLILPHYIPNALARSVGFDSAIWSVIPQKLIRDYILGENATGTSMETYLRHPEYGLLTPEGKSTLWKYACSQYALDHKLDHAALGISLVRWCWEKIGGLSQPLDFGVWCDLVSERAFASFVHSSALKDVYNDDTYFGNFVIALAGRVFPDISADSRFCFYLPSSAAAAPPMTSETIRSTSQSKVIAGNLAQAYGIKFHLIALDPSVQFVNVSQSTQVSPNGLMQIVLLDDHDRLIDVVKSDAPAFARGIGLRGGKVRKLLLCEANLDAPRSYTVQINAQGSFPDLMMTRWNHPIGKELIANERDAGWTWDTPDLWLTAASRGASSTLIDIIPVAPGLSSVVHVRVHNHGSVNAQGVRVYFYYQKGCVFPADDDGEHDDLWQPMELYGFAKGRNWVELNVPANSSAEAEAQWRYALINPATMEGIAVSIAAELRHPDDTSPDNNRVTKNHTYAVGELVPNYDDFKVVLDWPTVAITDKRPWVVEMMVNREDIYQSGAQVEGAIHIDQLQETLKGLSGTRESSAALHLGLVTSKLSVHTKASAIAPAKTPGGRAMKPLVQAEVVEPPEVTFSAVKGGQKMGGFTFALPPQKKQTKVESKTVKRTAKG